MAFSMFLGGATSALLGFLCLMLVITEGQTSLVTPAVILFSISFLHFWPAVFVSEYEVAVRNIRTRTIPIEKFHSFALALDSKTAKSYRLYSATGDSPAVWALFCFNPFYPFAFDGNSKRAARLTTQIRRQIQVAGTAGNKRDPEEQ